MMTNRPRTDRGFTFLEILVAVIFLMAGITFMFALFTHSNRGTLDSYRETVAYSIAFETLEWVAGLGYENLQQMLRMPGSSLEQKLGLNRFTPVVPTARDNGTAIAYPEDYRQFERMVEVTPIPAARVFQVRVTVAPIQNAFIRRGSVILERLVGAEYD